MTDDAVTQKNDASALVRRAVALSLGAGLGSLAMPAVAIPTAWPEADNPSLLGALLLIGGPVLALIAIITVLTYLPSMMRSRGPGEIAYDDPEWFGGPRTGVRTEEEGIAEKTGGSGGRW